jgi:hypothetical protein
MTDRPELRVQPTAATGATESLQSSPGAPGTGLPRVAPRTARHDRVEEPAATTGGQLRPTYARFVVDPDTHEVLVRIHDASTDEVITQIPSEEVESLNKALRAYADALARRKLGG